MKFTGETFISYTSADGLSNDIVLSIIEDQSHNLWFSTYGNGICKYDPLKSIFTNYSIDNGLNNKTVWTSIIDRNNNLWFGTSDGVSKFDGHRFVNFTKEDGLGAKIVYALHEDNWSARQGIIWLGTTEGLSKYDPFPPKAPLRAGSGSFTNFNAFNTCSSVSISAP